MCWFAVQGREEFVEACKVIFVKIGAAVIFLFQALEFFPV